MNWRHADMGWADELQPTPSVYDVFTYGEYGCWVALMSDFLAEHGFQVHAHRDHPHIVRVVTRDEVVVSALEEDWVQPTPNEVCVDLSCVHASFATNKAMLVLLPVKNARLTYGVTLLPSEKDNG